MSRRFVEVAAILQRSRSSLEDAALVGKVLIALQSKSRRHFEFLWVELIPVWVVLEVEFVAVGPLHDKLLAHLVERAEWRAVVWDLAPVRGTLVINLL